ncbi:MAG: RDD family protein, partial [Candidatus Binataceae bacterium]
SPMRRLGGYLLEVPLIIVTLGIGYLIWALIAYTKGQTPGKQLLGMRVVTIADGHAAGFGVSFLREVIAKPVIGVLSFVTLGIVNFWLLWAKDTQELWDKVVGTIVVNDREGLTVGTL